MKLMLISSMVVVLYVDIDNNKPSSNHLEYATLHPIYGRGK